MLAPAPPAPRAHSGPASLAHVLWITGLLSLCSGTYWHGLSFIARHAFDFSPARNQALFVVLGLLYTAVAFTAGRLSRALSAWLCPRDQLVGLMLASAGAAAFLGVWPSERSLWISAIVMNLATAVLWPLVEAYLTRARDGASMRAAVGGFNATWMLSASVAMIAVGPAIQHHLQGALLALALSTVPAIVLALRLPRQPGEHRHDAAAVHVTPLYPALLRSARVLMPLSYTFAAAMGPLLPYRLEALAVPLAWATPATATWMIARWLPALVFSRWRGWHGRPGPLWLGSLCTCLGVAGVLLAPSMGLLLTGFVVFGLGMGMLYHVTLYYSMAVGHGDVDASALFEALVGVGQTAGPVLALATGIIGGAPALAIALASLATLGVGGTAREIWRARRETSAEGRT